MYYISFDLIMVIIIAVALFDGMLTGALSGFAAGMILDFAAGNIAGISAFIYAIDAFIVSKLITAGFKPTWLTYSFLVFLMTEINILLLNLILYLFNFSIDWSAISLELLVRPVCNIVLMFIIFPLIRMSSGRGGSEEIEFEHKYKDQV